MPQAVAITPEECTRLVDDLNLAPDLPDVRKQVLGAYVLTANDDLGVEEIAALVGCHRGTVFNCWHDERFREGMRKAGLGIVYGSATRLAQEAVKQALKHDERGRLALLKQVGIVDVADLTIDIHQTVNVRAGELTQGYSVPERLRLPAENVTDIVQHIDADTEEGGKE